MEALTKHEKKRRMEALTLETENGQIVLKGDDTGAGQQTIFLDPAQVPLVVEWLKEFANELAARIRGNRLPRNEPAGPFATYRAGNVDAFAKKRATIAHAFGNCRTSRFMLQETRGGAAQVFVGAFRHAGVSASFRSEELGSSGTSGRAVSLQTEERREMSDRTIDQYDVATGWSKVPDVFGEFRDLEGMLTANGFEVYLKLGTDHLCQITAYSGRGEGYLVVLDAEARWEMIVTPNLPSLVELLSKLSPISVAASLECLRYDVSALSELLTGRGGPLEEALRNKRELDRRDLERSKRVEAPES